MISELIAKQRAFFGTGVTLDLGWRGQQLRLLRQAIRKRQKELLAALQTDLGKPAFEAFTSEILVVLEEIDVALRNLRRWARPRKVPTSMAQLGGKATVRPEPLGVVLIIGAWNYPFFLIMAPLVGAIAAGNCAILKPSERAPATSKFLAELCAACFPSGAIAVVEGGIPETQALLAERFDRIFYTGGAQVGRIVMAAAARNLTPVTLELGGKSPAIVDREADLELAAKRIVWGKFFNAGQTCVAPDYVLLEQSIAEDAIAALKRWIHRFYGENPQQSPDYARIVSAERCDRLVGLLAGANVVCGGTCDRDDRYFAPTIVRDVPVDSPLLQEEIFGPILPAIAYGTLAEAIAFVRDRPKPLALYFFSQNPGHQERVLRELSFGNGCINDVLLQTASPHLPFGGVGDSGMGSYRGKAGFDTFSHYKSVLLGSTWLDLALRYPPYRPGLLRWLFR